MEVGLIDIVKPPTRYPNIVKVHHPIKDLLNTLAILLITAAVFIIIFAWNDAFRIKYISREYATYKHYAWDITWLALGILLLGIDAWIVINLLIFT